MTFEFAEIQQTAPGQRVFDVAINGQTVLHDFDIFAEAGGANAHAVCVDLNQGAAEATAKEITDKYGVGIGVAGTGVSNYGLAVGLSGNITDRTSVRTILNNAVLAYGGFDSIAARRTGCDPQCGNCLARAG